MRRRRRRAPTAWARVSARKDAGARPRTNWLGHQFYRVVPGGKAHFYRAWRDRAHGSVACALKDADASTWANQPEGPNWAAPLQPIARRKLLACPSGQL